MVMTVLLTNNARSTLLSGINALQTEIRLRAGGGNTFPTITAPGQWFPITIEDSVGAIEIMRVIARSGDVFTVRRAQEGTTAKSFSANDVVELRLTVGAMQELVSDTHTNFGRIYMTPADGVDSNIGVPAGYYFNVRSPSDDSYVDEYQNVNGVAVATGKSYPSGALTQAMSEQIDRIGSLDYLSEQLDQIAVDKGWDASFVVDGNLTQHERNSGIKSIVQLRQTTPSKIGDRVYLVSVNEGQGKGAGEFIATQKSGLIDNGGTIISSPHPNLFWVRQFKEQYSIEDFGGLCDYSFETQTGTDNLDAINKSLSALGYALITGNAAVSDVIYLNSDQSIRKSKDGACLIKTSNSIGSHGTNIAPNRTGVSDSYDIDACVALLHEDNLYTTNVNIDVDLHAESPSQTSVAIYAPRFYICNFELKTFGFGTPIQTYDGFNSKVSIKAVGSAYGPRWLSDGSGNMTGTTIDFSNTWVLFDTSYNQPIKGFDLYQLWYSFGSNVAVDNGLRADEQAIYAYDFYNCKSLSFTALGAENNCGCVIRSRFSSISIESIKTAAHRGGLFSDDVGFYEVSQGSLTIRNATTDAIIDAGNIFNELIGEAGQISYVNAAKPTGGQSKPIGANGLRSVDNRLQKRTYIADDVMHVRDGVLFKREFSASTYQGLLRIFTSSTLALKLTLIAKGTNGTLQKTFNIVSSGGTTQAVVESLTSVGAMPDITLDFSASGDVFAVCAETSLMRFYIECYDTYLHDSANNFLLIY